MNNGLSIFSRSWVSPKAYLTYIEGILFMELSKLYVVASNRWIRHLLDLAAKRACLG
jgi:hypothetical protein